MEAKDRVKQILKDCCGGNASLATDILHEEFVIIHRDELPKVTMDGNRAEAGACSRSIRDEMHESRDTAVSLLAIHEFVAAKKAEHARDKRRDELARELVEDGAYAYRFAEGPLKLAIDKILELEGASE